MKLVIENQNGEVFNHTGLRFDIRGWDGRNTDVGLMQMMLAQDDNVSAIRATVTHRVGGSVFRLMTHHPIRVPSSGPRTGDEKISLAISHIQNAILRPAMSRDNEGLRMAMKLLDGLRGAAS